MSTPPKFCVLKAPGINCEVESAAAVELAGGAAEIVHVNQLLEDGGPSLGQFQGLFIPGGFSEGDAVRAGIVLALQLKHGLGDEIRTFVEQRKPVLGICNGFQVLVAMGLLPGDGNGGKPTASLTKNASGRFESRWVDLSMNSDAALVSPFVPRELSGETISLPIANGEGRFVADNATLSDLQTFGQVLMYYCDQDGQPSMDPQHNPSGSALAIAAISDQHGTVMGSMPHIERMVTQEQAINHRRDEAPRIPYGQYIMSSIVDYAGQL